MKDPNLTALYVYAPIVFATYVLLWLIFHKRERIAGILIAGLAGALGGFVPLFQKMSTTPLGLSQPLLRLHFSNDTVITSLLQRGAKLLSNPWALTWIVISLLSMVVMQFAYRRGKAIQLIPAFAGNTITIPIVGGLIAFGERLHPLQWIGVVLILSGVLLLTVKTGHVLEPSSRNP
jgi:drug/metabolite transporter (DMT)-like permease